MIERPRGAGFGLVVSTGHRGYSRRCSTIDRGGTSASWPKDHGSSVKDDKQYEGLRKKGMSKEARREDRQTRPDASSKGRQETAHSGGLQPEQQEQRVRQRGPTAKQKQEAGRKGGKATAKNS